MVDLMDHIRVPLSILVTDDDNACRESLAEVFEHMGFTAYRAESGHKAIDLVRQMFVHILFMDINMPDIDGFETYRIIKSFTKPLPCVFTTGENPNDVRTRAFSEEAFTVVYKPIDISLIKEVVDEILMKYYPNIG